MGAKSKAWIAVKKKRGGQPGNRNRWIHGCYSRELKARRAHVRALIAECDAAIALAKIKTLAMAGRKAGHPTFHQVASKLDSWVKPGHGKKNYSAASRLARFCAYIAWSARAMARSGLSPDFSSNAP